MVQFFDAWLGLYVKQRSNTNEPGGSHLGQGLVEYALILWFVAIVVFVTILFFADKVTALYYQLGSSVPN